MIKKYILLAPHSNFPHNSFGRSYEMIPNASICACKCRYSIFITLIKVFNGLIMETEFEGIYSNELS
jgi:hypothetical protein